MRRRRWAVFGVLVCLGLAGVVVTRWLTAPKHRITAETARQVRPGQTASEVERLFGVPAGNYATGRRADLYDQVLMVSGHVRPDSKWWFSDYWMLEVEFDRGGRVTVVKQSVATPAEETFIERLRRWFGL